MWTYVQAIQPSNAETAQSGWHGDRQVDWGPVITTGSTTTGGARLAGYADYTVTYVMPPGVAGHNENPTDPPPAFVLEDAAKRYLEKRAREIERAFAYLVEQFREELSAAGYPKIPVGELDNPRELAIKIVEAVRDYMAEREREGR